MNVRYIVDLSEAERCELSGLTAKGTASARKVKRANILLMADQRAHQDDGIARALGAGPSTIYRTKRRFIEGGLAHALSEARRKGGPRKLDPNEEATLVALACTTPPEGRAKWTMQLLADRLVAVTDVGTISAETVRRRLSENRLKPWQKRMWCIPDFDADYVANMEDVLEIYALPRNSHKPLVCFDETSKQLLSEVRIPIAAKPGRPERFDCEYRRHGTANLFLFVAPLEGWRHVKVTEHRGNTDFAECMRELVDVHFPDAEIIRVVLDNLNTHRPGALYHAFPAPEARRILRKLEFHYTPKHGSWLNMAELEIGILDRQCLDRRIGDATTLAHEIAAWEADRNTQRATIQWMFDIDRARTKLTRAYDAARVTSGALEAA